MAKKGRSRAKEPLPPPLPPETRTVGQLIAETIRFYRHHFWQSLPLGICVALVTQLAIELSRAGETWHEKVYDATPDEAARLATATTPLDSTDADFLTASGAGFVVWALGGPLLLTLAFVAASRLVAGVKLEPQRVAVAFAAGLLALIPVPVISAFLGILSILPVVAWLAFVGLAVPVAVIEGSGLRASFSRATRLARADFIHAFGGLAGLAVVYFVTRLAMLLLLRGAGESTARTAALLADLVVSPILFLGAALLYYDQAARLSSGRSRHERRRDAHVPDALDAVRPGAADAAVEPRPASRGEPGR